MSPSPPNPPRRGRASSASGASGPSRSGPSRSGPSRSGPGASGSPSSGSSPSGSGSDGFPVSRGVRYVWYVLLLVLGALVGAAGALVQAAWLPAGLLLALLATAGLFYGGLRATGTQTGVVAAGVGWLVAVVLLSFGRPEGDGVFGGGVGELLFLFGGMGVAVMCATLSRLPRPTR
ncbi:DUF6113 family protein [Streptomyces sp. WAC08241]|uniref:DUF6113 family protein n=1 Tax=Streptomyces sp. WAC08241 TaxID=2487421 RepID=UPI001C8E59E8|nr:DUF6113 family protein [Streptomyces sp. WAC08241]